MSLLHHQYMCVCVQQDKKGTRVSHQAHKSIHHSTRYILFSLMIATQCDDYDIGQEGQEGAATQLQADLAAVARPG